MGTGALIRSLRELKNGLSKHRSQTEPLRTLKYGNDLGVVDTCGARSLTVRRNTRHYAPLAQQWLTTSEGSLPPHRPWCWGGSDRRALHFWRSSGPAVCP